MTQKENSILENHKALWEKVFNSIDKSTVEDATATNYGDFLANSLDKIKDKFSDDELKSLKEDVEEIKKLEDELQPLLEKQSANASNKDSGKEGASVFPEFHAKDLDGNDVDSSIISKNAVTVLNFWFNGCSPCVQELPELNKLNEVLKEKGGQVIGINTDSLDGNEDGIAEAKSILEKQGQNIRIFPLIPTAKPENMQQALWPSRLQSCLTVTEIISESRSWAVLIMTSHISS